MKFKRLLAAILSALMITSCMSFVASAQETQTVTEPVAYYTAKGAHGSFRVMGGLTKTRMYDAVEDVIFYHHTDIAGGNKHYDAYGLGTVPVTNGLIYFAADIRTNYSATPNLNVYGAKLTGSTSNDGGYFSAASATKADGNWERVVIKIENEKLESFNQNHIKLLGSSTPANFIGDKYLDVAVFGYFNDEYSALNYDFGTLTAPDGAASFSIDGVETTDVPTTDPEPDSGYFMGWSVDDDATRGDAVTALSTVPDADTTYYAIFSGEIEDEKAVYLSASGDDANSGRHSKVPVKTLARAQEILVADKAADNIIDTIVVVGMYEKKYEAAASVENFGAGLGKKITITGYDADAVFDMRYYNASGSLIDSHLRIATDVEFNNIRIYGSSKDGGIMSQGYELTFGENIVLAGGSQNIGFLHYNAQKKDFGVVNVLSGSYNKVDMGVQSGQTYRGTATLNIGGTANTKIYNGHGYKGTQAVYGIANVNIDGGNVSSISLSATADTAVTNYSGLRYFTINGGTVGAVSTTGSSVSKIYDTDVSQATSAREGVTVFEYNGGTVASIKTGVNKQTGEADPDNATRVIILNNGMTTTVEDEGAIVVGVTGGNLHAVTNAYDAEGNPTYGDYTALNAEWGKTIKLTGFTYDTEYDYYDTVKIGDKEIALADLEDGIIPASEFTAGVNTVEFLFQEEEHIAAYRAAGAKIVYVSEAGTGSKKGTSPGDAYATLKTALDAEAATEGKVVFAILDDVKITTNADMNIGKDILITSVGGDIYTTSHPTFKTNGGSNIVIENIDIYHTRATGGINGEIYLVAKGNNLTLKNVNAIPYSEREGEVRTDKLYVQPGGDGGNFTKTEDTKLVLENVTGIYVRGGGYGGSTFAGGIDYVVGGKSEFSSILAGIQAAGSSAQKTVDDVLQFDADGNPVTNQPEANRTVNGDIAVAVKDEAKITTITATNYGILKGDLVITVQDDATVGTVDFAASSVKKKNQAGDADVVMAAGRLEGNGIVYILGGSVGTVKGTQGKKRAVVVDLNNAVVPANIANVNNIVTYEGNGTVTIAYAEDGTASIALAPGADVKYIRITNGDNVKSYTVAGDEVTLLEEVDFNTIALSEGTTTVEFLEDATEATTVTFNANGGTFASTGTDTITVDLAIGSTVTGETVEVPTKANAIFAGWTPADAVVTAGIVYTANWTPAYDIKFVVNGEETTQQYLENESVTFPTITVTEDDKKTFLGWSTVSATDKENLITDTSAITATENKTYYAVIVNWPIVTYQWAGYEHSKQYVYGTKIDFFPVSKADKNYRYDFIGWQDGENVYKNADEAPALTEDVTYVGLFSEEGVAITEASVSRTFDSLNLEQVEHGKYGQRFIQTKEQIIDGITASKITPNADIVETHDGTISIEGSNNYPINDSLANDAGYVNFNTYPYIAVKYYYEPGTAEESRKLGLWIQKEPWQYNPGDSAGNFSHTMTAGKWTYAVYQIPEGKQPSSQYHLYPYSGVNISTLATTGEELYLHSISIFKEQPTLATVTFKGEDGTVLYAIDALNSEAVTYNGAAVEKADHTFKGWAIENTTEVVEALTFAQDTVLVPVFEENPQEVFPTSPTYKTYGVYDASTGLYEVELRLSGTTGNVGSFGFTFPAEYMTLKSVTANAEAGVVLLAEEASESAQTSPIFVKDTENGYYANTWTAELATGYGYVDATSSEVLIATFTFEMTADQRTAFKTAVVDTNGKFAEYAVADADEKYYKDGKYLVAPYSPDLSTNKLAINYVSHTDEEGEVEVTTATITLTVNLHDERGTVGTSLATLAVNGGEAVVIEQASVGGDITYTISGLEIGKPCTISVKKNGYVEGICEVTPNAAFNTLTMELVAGDIKDKADAACGDGVIDLSDFVRVLRAFDPDASDDFRLSMDINEDGAVTVADLALIKFNYGQTIGDAAITFNGETISPKTQG